MVDFTTMDFDILKMCGSFNMKLCNKIFFQNKIFCLPTDPDFGLAVTGNKKNFLVGLTHTTAFGIPVVGHWVAINSAVSIAPFYRWET